MGLDIDHIRQIVERVAVSSGLELVEIDLRGAGKARMLRIVIDKPSAGGVSHEDCASLSREVGTILDVEDAVPGGSYVLEVSSPGLDRKLVRLADYQRFTGNRVRLTTRQPINGNRYFEGRLESVQEARLTLDLSPVRKKHQTTEVAQRKLEIELANVEKANLVPEF